jgi:hypothetical protein
MSNDAWIRAVGFARHVGSHGGFVATRAKGAAYLRKRPGQYRARAMRGTRARSVAKPSCARAVLRAKLKTDDSFFSYHVRPAVGNSEIKVPAL